MIEAQEIRADQSVRLMDDHCRGTVREVDHLLRVARVALNKGGEAWVRLEELEVVEPWHTRRLEYGSIGGDS